jgi:hypothetical protein
MKTFADIEKIFFREKRPYYVVKDSRGARKSTTPSDIMEGADPEQRLKESFEFLTEAVQDFDDGKYKLLLRTSESAGKGELSYDFQIGDAANSKSESTKTGSISGFNIAGLDTIMGLINGGRSEADRLREEKADLKLELVKKEFEIERLKENAAVSGVGESWGDVIKGVVKEYFPDILDKYAPAKTEVASIRGSKAVPADAGKTPKKETKTEKVELDGASSGEKITQQEAKERLTAIFERTEILFPDYNPLVTIEVVLDMAEKNEFVVRKVNNQLKKLYDTE